MKYIIKLQYVLIMWIFIGFSFTQDISMTLNIINAGFFSIDDWNDDDKELWSITVINNGTEDVDYNIKFEFYFAGDEVVSGKTKWAEIEPTGVKKWTNGDFNSTAEQRKVREYWESSGFMAGLKTIGYLAQGSYEIKVYLYVYPDEISIDEQSEEMTINIVSDISLESPDNEYEIPNFSPQFKWSSPGFGEGVIINYNFIIAEYHEDESMDDIFSNAYYIVYETGAEGITKIETGSPQTISYNLLDEHKSPLQDFICGYEYVWRVQAKDDVGIWGWDSPKISEIRKFTWGQQTPELSITSEYDDVLPTFIWDDIWCAEDGYDIQITHADDNEFENSWEDNYVFPGFQYPLASNELYAPGLIPGESYNWRIRAHSITGATPWSKTNTFKIQGIELIEPEKSQIIESVRPYFNINAPKNITSYKILIGDESTGTTHLSTSYR